LLKHKDGLGKFSVKYLQQGLVPMGYLKSVFISEISEINMGISRPSVHYLHLYGSMDLAGSEL